MTAPLRKVIHDAKPVIDLHIHPAMNRLVLKQKLIGPMISGHGPADAGVEPMKPGRWWVALICLAAAIGATRWIIAGAPPLGG